jgi:uncharacterized SAM-binding protein YcdF (DUF218 family)
MTTGAYCRDCGDDKFACATCTSTREQFCALLSNGQLLAGDVVVVLAGEDGFARADFAAELLRRGGAPIALITGGLDDATKQGATKLMGRLLGKGFDPQRIRVDVEARNTREQAVRTVQMAKDEGWKRLLLVASPYHQYRATLTFIHALRQAKLDESIHVLSVPATHAHWFDSPDGVSDTRLDLLASEFAKVETYQAKGDCASYEDGIAYLRFWEGKP